MYSVDEWDKVVELKNVPQSSVGAPLPIVLADEHKILLAYIAEITPPEWNGSYVRVVAPSKSDEPLVLVEFSSYSSFNFGAPNDEAFDGHPLEGRGLHPYGAFQIENSSWVRQLERMNSVHPEHKPERFAQLRHFVFAFHDSTFECVAERLTVSQHKGSLERLLPLMQSRLQ